MRAKLGFLLFSRIGGYAGLIVNSHIPGVTRLSPVIHNENTGPIELGHGSLLLYPRFMAGVTLSLN